MPWIVMVSIVHQYANLEVVQVHILNFILYSQCVILIKVNVGDYHVTRHIAQKISKSCILSFSHIIVEDKFFVSWFQVLYKV
jgi:hypothetical protein